MDFAITKMSCKGQIVIPVEMREDLEEGEKLLVIKEGDQLIMQRLSKLNKKFEEDLIFAKRTQEALDRYDKNPESFEKIEMEEFLKKLKY